MSAILTIAEREVRERKALLLVVLACSIGNLALLFAPGLAVGAPSLRDVASATLGLALPTAIALGVGASVIGRDLAERRLGFYFSRPFSAFAIWAGKTLGGLIPVLLATLLCTGSVLWVNDDLGGWYWALSIVLTVLVFLMAQVGSALYRSRSTLLIFDVVALVVVAIAVSIPGRALHYAGADEAIQLAVPAGIAVLIAGLLTSGWLLIAKGRGDGARGHVALSSTLWTVLGLGAVAFAGYSRWVLAAPPSMEGGTRWRFDLPPRGDTFFLGAAYWGGRAGFRPTFWIDARSGRHEIAPLSSRSSWPLFSSDGQRAYWTTLHDDGTAELEQRDWSTGRRMNGRAALSEAQYCGPVALSPSEKRLLLNCGSVSRVVETQTGRTVSETKGALWQSRAFVVEDQVRGCSIDSIRPGSGWTLTCRDWEPSTGRLTGDVAIPGTRARVIDQLDERLLLFDPGEGRASLVEGPPGAFRVREVLGAGAGSGFLADGSILAVAAGGGQIALSHMRPDTSPISRVLVALDSPCAEFIGEAAPGLVALRLSSQCQQAGGSRWFFEFEDSLARGDKGVAFVDLASGRIAGLEKQLRAFSARDRTARELGGLATRMFIDEAGRLIVRDPQTGTRRVLLEGPQSPEVLP